MQTPSAIDASVLIPQTVRLWDAQAAAAACAAAVLLPEPKIKSDEWWDRMALKQGEDDFRRDFRMSKQRFWQVCARCGDVLCIAVFTCAPILQVLHMLYPDNEEKPHRFGPTPTPREKRFACALWRISRSTCVPDVSSKVRHWLLGRICTKSYRGTR